MMLISQKYISLVFLRHIITTPLGMLSPSNPPIRDDLMYFRSGSQSLPRGLPSKSHAFRSDSGHWRRLDFRWRSWWLNEWISDWSICFIFRFIKLILFGLILVVFNPLEKKCCHNVVKCRIFFLKKKIGSRDFLFQSLNPPPSVSEGKIVLKKMNWTQMCWVSQVCLVLPGFCEPPFSVNSRVLQVLTSSNPKAENCHCALWRLPMCAAFWAKLHVLTWLGKNKKNKKKHETNMSVISKFVASSKIHGFLLVFLYSIKILFYLKTKQSSLPVRFFFWHYVLFQAGWYVYYIYAFIIYI